MAPTLTPDVEEKMATATPAKTKYAHVLRRKVRPKAMARWKTSLVEGAGLAEVDKRLDAPAGASRCARSRTMLVVGMKAGKTSNAADAEMDAEPVGKTRVRSGRQSAAGQCRREFSRCQA